MDATFVYLVKSSGLLTVFLLAYYLLLHRETFFAGNRWYLLAGLVTSAVLPLVTFTKVVWVEPAAQAVYYDALSQVSTDAPVETQINWAMIITVIYIVGLTVCFLKFIIDCIALRRMLAGKAVLQDGGFKFVDITESVSPFSFFSTIVYNSKMYSEAELNNILEHEKIHSRQAHSADVIIARVFCMLFWFNPLVWLYKKAMIQNLEFIADSEAVKQITDIKSYQFTLLKITTHQNCVAITNHFYQSLIKKRIVMLNKNQSKRQNSWKYALIVPVLAAFLLVFQLEVIAKEKPRANVLPAVQKSIEVVVDKNTSDAQMDSDVTMLKKEHDIVLKFSKVKRNNNNEITAIKAEYKDNSGKTGVVQISSDEPISPIRFYKNASGIGFGKSGGITIVQRNQINDTDLENLLGRKSDSDTLEGEHTINVIKSKNGTGTIVTMNGEVIVDTDKILAELEPITIDGINIVSNGDDGKRIEIDARTMTRDAMKVAELALKKARTEMAESLPEMDRIKMSDRNNLREIEQARRELEQSKRQIEQANRELEQAKREIEQSRREMEQARREMEQSRRALEQKK